jgi:hypothetical protein
MGLWRACSFPNLAIVVVVAVHRTMAVKMDLCLAEGAVCGVCYGFFLVGYDVR